MATSSGLAISNDGGTNWTTKTSSDGLTNNDIRDVYAFKKADDSIKVYVRTSASVQISNDGGITWATTNMNISGANKMFVRGKTIILTANQLTRFSNDDGASETSWYNNDALGKGMGGYSGRDQVWIGNDYIFSTGGGINRSKFP